MQGQSVSSVNPLKVYKDNLLTELIHLNCVQGQSGVELIHLNCAQGQSVSSVNPLKLCARTICQ